MDETTRSKRYLGDGTSYQRTKFKDDDLHTQITVSAANLDLTKEIKICDT